MWFTIGSALIKIIFLLIAFVMPLASVLTWAERRQSAMMQDRLGPNRANIGPFKAWGLFHFVADALKFIFKEDLIPAKAHRFLFALAPILAMTPALIIFAIMPFGDFVCWGELSRHGLTSIEQCGGKATYMQISHNDMGVLFYLAIASLGVYGAVLAGWSSYNKWGLLGGLRGSSQMMAYEVTLGLSLVGIFLVYGTLEPHALVKAQGINPLHWGIVTQPIGFLLFFASALAEGKRTPFDLVEGEPEIIGYFVEYSGLRFGMFFLGEFIEIIFAAAIFTTVFFGGWYLPGVDFATWNIPHYVVIILQLVTWTVKVLIFCGLQLAIRWTLPRFRPDQLLQLGWLRMLPISVVNVVATAGALLLLK